VKLNKPVFIATSLNQISSTYPIYSRMFSPLAPYQGQALYKYPFTGTHILHPRKATTSIIVIITLNYFYQVNNGCFRIPLGSISGVGAMSLQHPDESDFGGQTTAPNSAHDSISAQTHDASLASDSYCSSGHFTAVAICPNIAKADFAAAANRADASYGHTAAAARYYSHHPDNNPVHSFPLTASIKLIRPPAKLINAWHFHTSFSCLDYWV